MALAREATLNGDIIEAENCYQHAEHYFRVTRERWTRDCTRSIYSLCPKRDGLAEIFRIHTAAGVNMPRKHRVTPGIPVALNFLISPWWLPVVLFWAFTLGVTCLVLLLRA
jgi:hypothetical protein